MDYCTNHEERDPDAYYPECPHCGGDEFFEPCRRCGGKGCLADIKCRKCDGKGGEWICLSRSCHYMKMSGFTDDGQSYTLRASIGQPITPQMIQSLHTLAEVARAAANRGLLDAPNT